MTATARRVGDGLQHEVLVNGRHTIVTDEPQRLGGSDLGPAPHELLAAMLAACVATMIAMYANRHEWEIGRPSVNVTYDPDTEPRRVEIEIDLPATLTPEQRRRLRRVADTCPARRALEAAWEFDERILATGSARAAA